MFDVLKVVLLCVGAALIAYYVVTHRVVEGFDGAVPAAAQSSMIPHDTAGSTTRNPTEAKPQARDVISVIEKAKNFQTLRDTYPPNNTRLPRTTQDLMARVAAQFPERNNLLQATLANSDSGAVSVQQLSQWNAEYDTLIRQLRNAAQATGAVADTNQAAAMAAQPVPAVAAGTPKTITIKELYDLRNRINAEKLRLANLRSRDATIRATIVQLDKIAADVGGFITQVERKQITLEDVPISPETANAFLKDLKAGKSPLPALAKPKPVHTAPKTKGPHATEVATDPTKQLQGLMQLAQLLKWDLEIKVQFDPKVAQNAEMLTRIKDIEKKLNSYAVADHAMPPTMAQFYLKEMETYSNALTPRDGLDNHISKLARVSPPPIGTATRVPQQHASSAEYPSVHQLSATQSISDSQGAFPNGDPHSRDVYIRPGYPVTDEMIARRGSSSTFDEAALGGYDYKTRVHELCKQIKQANLGEGKDFGCISNPSEVSHDYSWKGNYLTVCNRLGDTWGGWYPEMFGCPKYDPTQKFRGQMM